MSDRPIGEALERLAQSGDGLEVLVEQEKDAGPRVTAAGSKTLGKGWSVAGAVQYARDRWSALGAVSWRPGKR